MQKQLAVQPFVYTNVGDVTFDRMYSLIWDLKGTVFQGVSMFSFKFVFIHPHHFCVHVSLLSEN